MLYMERGNCEEFLEVYKGVVPEYNVSCRISEPVETIYTEGA